MAMDNLGVDVAFGSHFSNLDLLSPGDFLKEHSISKGTTSAEVDWQRQAQDPSGDHVPAYDGWKGCQDDDDPTVYINLSGTGRLLTEPLPCYGIRPALHMVRIISSRLWGHLWLQPWSTRTCLPRHLCGSSPGDSALRLVHSDQTREAVQRTRIDQTRKQITTSYGGSLLYPYLPLLVWLECAAKHPLDHAYHWDQLLQCWGSPALRKFLLASFQ